MKKIMFILIVMLSAFALFAQSGALINQTSSEISAELMEQIAKTNAQTRNFSFNIGPSRYNIPDAADIADPETGLFFEDVPWAKDFSRHINNPDNVNLTLSFLYPSTKFIVSQPDAGNPLKLQFEPVTENWHGYEDLIMVATDLVSGMNATGIFRINVTSVPDPPIWSGLPGGNIFYTNEETALQIDFQDYVSCVDSADPRNFDLTVLYAEYPIVVTQEPPVTGSLVTFTPQLDYFGVASYELTAVDRLSNAFSSMTIHINVVNVNDSPEISAWQPEELTQNIDQGESLSFSVSAEDVEDDPLSYIWTHSGSQDETPFSNVVSTIASLDLQFDIPGTQTISCEVSDGEATDSKTWTVIVRPYGPIFNPEGGIFTTEVSVTLAPPAGFAGAEIFFTTDGTTPTDESAVYTAPIVVEMLTDLENIVTIQALFSYPGFPLSQIESQTYRITGTVAEPGFTPLGGLYYLPVEVTLGNSNPEAAIYYTIDGSNPEPENPGTQEYSVPITVTAETTLTIKALARRDGWLDSEIVSQTYQVTGAVHILAHTMIPPPLPEEEFYLIDQDESLAVGIAGLSVMPAAATVYYTLDNSLPGPENPDALVYSSGQQIQLTHPAWISFKAYLADWQASETYGYYYDVRTRTVFLPYANGTVFDPEPGYSSTPILVSISTSSNPADAEVYYTLDGREPDPGTALLYSEPIEISETTEIKALAKYPGLYSSAVHTGVFTITGTVSAPVFDPLPGSFPVPIELTMSSSTDGAAIYYSLDGSEPTQDGLASFLYEGPVALENGLHQVQAKAFKEYWDPSSVTEGTYITGLLPSPEFDLAQGIYFDPIVVHLSVPSVPAASIHYTTDGTEPTEDSTLYDPVDGIPIGLETSYTIKAIAVRSGWFSSEVAQRSYQVTGTVATPVFSPDGGSHSVSVTVSISSSTPEAVIRYTLDGEEPSLEYGSTYDEPILINSSATLKARAYRSDWRPSGVYGAIYTIIGNIANPVFIPGPGAYTTPPNVYILVSPPDASIYYTSDGSEPSSDNGIAYVLGTPINVSNDVLLRARAYKTGWNASGITDAQYYITGTVSDPVFDPPAGLYEGPQTVTLSAIPVTATIYYTSDGSEPNPGSGTEYVAGTPINVLSHVLLRARAYQSGWNPSGITDAQYHITGIGEHVPPAAVEGVHVNIIGNDAFISWLPVTQTIYGTPMTPDLYVVLYNETPYEDDNYYYYLTSTENLSTIHTRVALFRDAMFYRVVAVKFNREGESDVLAALNSSREEILWSELKTRLANVRDKQ